MKLKSRVEFISESLDDLFTSVHEGDYNCSSKGLTSLVDLNIPNKVTGNFTCSNNKLTSLEGSPQEVDGHFYCYNNQLTSLEGCPQEVGGNFICSDNQLTSLNGHPKVVKGDFFIKGSLKITDEMIKDLKKNCKIGGKIIR